MKKFHAPTWLWGSCLAFSFLGIVGKPEYAWLLSFLGILILALSWYGRLRPRLTWQALCSFLTCLAGGGWLFIGLAQPTAFSSIQFGAGSSFVLFGQQLIVAHSHSLGIAMAGSLGACLAGLLVGAVLGMATGWVARILNPFLQTLMAIPILLYLLVGLVIFPPGKATLILVFGITLWLEPARMIQVRLQELRQAPFVHVARTMGAGSWRILWRECRPNIMPVIWVSFLIVFLNAILLESILGFLGLGLSPGTPSLGKFIEEGGKAWPQHPQYLLGPLLLEIAWMLGLRGIMRRADQRNRPLRVA